MKIRGFAYGGLMLAVVLPSFRHEDRERPHTHQEQRDDVRPWGQLTHMVMSTTSSTGSTFGG